MPTKKLYILVRKDLGLSHIAVQAGHGVGEWVKTFPCSALSDWNDTLIYLGVSNEEELLTWYKKLSKVEEYIVEWREGFWNDSLTSIAVLGSDKVKEMVKELKLI